MTLRRRTFSTLLLAAAFAPRAAAAFRSPAPPPAAAAEPEWGAPVDGIRLRAHPPKRPLTVAEIPEIMLDVRNDGPMPVPLHRIPFAEVEIDGVWYVPVPPHVVAGAVNFASGEVRERYSTIRLNPGRWARRPPPGLGKHDRTDYVRDPKNRLVLTATKHTVRVAVISGGKGPISQPVEFDIVPGSSPAPLP